MILLVLLVVTVLVYTDIMNRNKYFDELIGYIPTGVSVLDFGAGTCDLSKYIGHRNAVTSIDIHTSCEDADVYDGYTLPYEDDAFDVVVSMFVLHHIPHHESIIKELRRVARSRVIVIEDMPTTPYQRFISRVHYLYFQQSTRTIENMKTPEAWCASLGGQCTIKKLASRSIVNPTPHYIIVKDVAASRCTRVSRS